MAKSRKNLGVAYLNIDAYLQHFEGNEDQKAFLLSLQRRLSGFFEKQREWIKAENDKYHADMALVDYINAIKNPELKNKIIALFYIKKNLKVIDKATYNQLAAINQFEDSLRKKIQKNETVSLETLFTDSLNTLLHDKNAEYINASLRIEDIFPVISPEECMMQMAKVQVETLKHASSEVRKINKLLQDEIAKETNQFDPLDFLQSATTCCYLELLESVKTCCVKVLDRLKDRFEDEESELIQKAEKNNFSFQHNQHAQDVVNLGGRYLPFFQLRDPLVGQSGLGVCEGYVRAWSACIEKVGYYPYLFRLTHTIQFYQGHQSRLVSYFDFFDQEKSYAIKYNTDLHQLILSIVNAMSTTKTYTLGIEDRMGNGHAMGLRLIPNTDEIEFFDPNLGIVVMEKSKLALWLAKFISTQYGKNLNDGKIVLEQNGKQPLDAQPSIPTSNSAKKFLPEFNSDSLTPITIEVPLLNSKKAKLIAEYREKLENLKKELKEDYLFLISNDILSLEKLLDEINNLSSWISFDSCQNKADQVWQRITKLAAELKESQENGVPVILVKANFALSQSLYKELALMYAYKKTLDHISKESDAGESIRSVYLEKFTAFGRQIEQVIQQKEKVKSACRQDKNFSTENLQVCLEELAAKQHDLQQCASDFSQTLNKLKSLKAIIKDIDNEILSARFSPWKGKKITALRTLKADVITAFHQQKDVNFQKIIQDWKTKRHVNDRKLNYQIIEDFRFGTFFSDKKTKTTLFIETLSRKHKNFKCA